MKNNCLGCAALVYVIATTTLGCSGAASVWNGTWKLDETKNGIPGLKFPIMLLTLDDRSLHIAFPSTGEYADLPLDGSDAPMRGLAIPQEVTLAVRVKSPREFLTLRKFGGIVAYEGSLKLSADGKTLIEEYWTPTRPEQKYSFVYSRQ